MNPKLKKIFTDITDLVEPAIEDILLDSVDKRHKEAVLHQMITGGKRLRPVLALLSSRMMEGEDEDVLKPAAALEILHNYTLIIDDQIDHSYFRRNTPTVWKRYGSSTAQCFGIYYISSVFQALGESENAQKLTNLFSKTLKKIDNGEILDILFERSGREDESYIMEKRFEEVDLDDYLEMIEGKTASLFETCLETGGICAGASKEDLKLLKEFGLNLGMAFQIRDDILDVFGNEKKLGKEVGKDIKERKASNIVVLLTIKKLNSKDREKLQAIFLKGSVTDEDVKEVMDLINKTDALEESEKLAKEFIEKSKENLRQLPQNKWTEIVAELADFIVNRDK